MEARTEHSRNVSENPCQMCMPMGAILPFKGIEQSMVIIHGSQGCSTYMRRHIAEHFNEPIDVGSSSLNEKGTIYGGEDNLIRGLDNIMHMYRPKMIGVLTTCLAETIGEDVGRICQDYLRARDLQDFPLLSVATPGYGGSHSEGYFRAVREIVSRLSRATVKHQKVNIIVPNLSPADLREIKRLLAMMELEYILCPDFSDTLDMPFIHSYQKIPLGGTRLDDIKAMGGAQATIQLGLTVEDDFSAGHYLEQQFGVPLYNLPIPMGIAATDRFLALLQELSGNRVPAPLLLERGRLLDGMIDSHKYNAQIRCAIFGEPELVYAVASTCLENGLIPAVVATGAKNGTLRNLLQSDGSIFTEDISLIPEADFTGIREQCKKKNVNLAIGHSDGRYLTEREGIPLVRLGYPIHDRVGGQRILSLGYQGTMQFLDRVTNTFLDNKQQHYRQNILQNYYAG